MREEAALCEEEEQKRAARGARFAAAPVDEAASERAAATRRAWPGGTMTVILPGQQPRAIVTQGGVPMTVIDDGKEGDGSMTTPATSDAASAKEPTEAPTGERPKQPAARAPTAKPREPRAMETAGRGDQPTGGGEEESKAGAGGERGKLEMTRSSLRRGTYITFLEGLHGQGAVGALSLTTGTDGLGVTWQGGFDLWATATELARERHGFGPLSGDADDVFEQAEVLPRADVAAMGSPCQQAPWAAWVASQGTERQCAPPDGDHPMNQLYWRQIQPMKRRVKALLIEFVTGVLTVASASDPMVEPGFLHHKMLQEIETADETV